MEIVEVSKKEFKNVIFNPFHAYGMADFNDLNKQKCRSVHYFLFRESKFRLGIIGGIVDDVFLSSFSAPFGGFLFIKDSVGIEFFNEAIDLLVEWGKSQNIKSIKLTLPPPIYHESFITKQINSLYRKNFLIKSIDMNYVFFTDKFRNGYMESLDQKSRNSLKSAIKQEFIFHKCENLGEKRLAYEIIEEHKKFKKYPIKMTWDQIEDTIQLIDADFFLLYLDDKTPIASAMVYHVSESVVQIIYWGDNRDYANLRVMNYLAYKLFEHYANTHTVIDLGPSSVNSDPNIGLCRFKEKIGCDITTKMYLEYEIRQ